MDEACSRFEAGFTFLVLGSDIFNLWQRGVEMDGLIAACAEGS